MLFLPNLHITNNFWPFSRTFFCVWTKLFDFSLFLLKQGKKRNDFITTLYNQLGIFLQNEREFLLSSVWEENLKLTICTSSKWNLSCTLCYYTVKMSSLSSTWKLTFGFYFVKVNFKHKYKNGINSPGSDYFFAIF